MKSVGNTFKLITVALACIFFLNMLIMHVFFNTDVFNPVNRELSKTSIAGFDFNSLSTPGTGVLAEDVGTEDTAAPTEDNYPKETNEGAVPEDNGTETANEAAEPDSSYFMTTGEVGFLGNLDMLDKLEALSLIAKVGKEEADRIYDLAMDGITYAEMKQIEDILKKYLDKAEMEKLTALLKKNKKQYSVGR